MPDSAEGTTLGGPTKEKGSTMEDHEIEINNGSLRIVNSGSRLADALQPENAGGNGLGGVVDKEGKNIRQQPSNRHNKYSGIITTNAGLSVGPKTRKRVCSST
jgi:hypothetical protein